jgi:short-subunit dehydrogenase
MRPPPALLAAAAGFGIGVAAARRARPAPSATVLISGGSRGFGLQLARAYLERGVRVAICARDADELARAKQDLERLGRPVLALPCDVRQAGSARELVAAVAQHLGCVDSLVHNAGVIQVGPAEHMTRADYDDALAVHLFGALNLVSAALPDMLARGRGRIVNVASIAGLVPFPHLLPYGASKAALACWSEGLRTELAGSGVTVTTVCPALMRTGSPRHALFKGNHRKEYAWFSIADSLPGVSIGAARAARRVVRAAERGQARVVVPAAARLAVVLYATAPGAALTLFGGIGRLLPAPGGIGRRSLPGSASTSAWSPSVLTVLDEQAARVNNQLPG